MLNRIVELFDMVGKADSPLKPTELFNEGWMLRLILVHLRNEGPQDHPFFFLPGARWYSEGLLPSPFLAEFRGDTRAEGWTNADGVIGHVLIRQNSRGELSLKQAAEQLVVVEAKMFSGLSPGVKRCAAYDQASRYVACIAELISRAKMRPERIDRLGFFVVAPNIQIESGIFGERLTKGSIEKSVRARVDTYAGARDQWFDEKFLPALSVINISLIAWETILAGLPQNLYDFYQRCIEFNQPRR